MAADEEPLTVQAIVALFKGRWGRRATENGLDGRTSLLIVMRMWIVMRRLRGGVPGHGGDGDS